MICLKVQLADMTEKVDVSTYVFLLTSSASLEDAMRQLDKSAGGVVFCVDGDGIMRGLLTDGDIRRVLLNGKTMSSPVDAVMNQEFVFGHASDPWTDNHKLLSPAIRHIPILDENKRPVDMISSINRWHIPVAEPSLGGNEMKYVADCINTAWISSQGAYVDKFQNIFCDFLGGGQALCTSSGTTALHLALKAMDIGIGDEVIVPAITFGASANVVIHTGATPVFVDITSDTRTMCPRALKQAITPATKAIMPVHLYGHPCDMDPIVEIAREHNLKIIEDCAEALGAEYKGAKVGLIGDVGAFSFFANKIITTGEGGMVVSKNQELLERMALLRDHGMTKERRYWHVEPGFNYRMTNLQAGIGLAQMERIDVFLQARRDVVAQYNKHLSGIEGIRIPPNADWAKNIYWLYSIEIDRNELGIDRDSLAKKLLVEGVDTRPVFPPLHIQPAFGEGELGTHLESEFFADRGLCLPTANGMTTKDVDRICETIIRIVHNA